jgi:hypothetical protein
MTLVIDLTPTEEAHLQAAARAEGIEPEEFAKQLIVNFPRANGVGNGALKSESERHRGLDELVAESQKLGLY